MHALPHHVDLGEVDYEGLLWLKELSFYLEWEYTLTKPYLARDTLLKGELGVYNLIKKLGARQEEVKAFQRKPLDLISLSFDTLQLLRPVLELFFGFADRLVDIHQRRLDHEEWIYRAAASGHALGCILNHVEVFPAHALEIPCVF